MCRRAYGEIRLHRPLGDQLRLFFQHLPAQRTRVAGYDDTLTTEQVAAMMPNATHAAGSRSRLLPRTHALGLQAAGPVQPQGGLRQRPQHDDPERRGARLGQDDARPEARVRGFLLGARVIDCDPKGDHRFHLLDGGGAARRVRDAAAGPGAAGCAGPAEGGAGAPASGRAVSFLRDLLPGRAEPAWETAVVAAVDRVMRCAREPTCLEVVRALERGR